MIVRTKGRPDKIPTKLCKEAVRFYGKHLLGPRLFSKVEVLLDFTEKLDPHIHATCMWEDNNRKSREFILSVNPILGKRSMLMTLAHEMVHVKQYAKGELVDFTNKDCMIKCRWKGDLYDLKKNDDYWEHPWEIEAHGREKGLYLKFVWEEERKKKLLEE